MAWAFAAAADPVRGRVNGRFQLEAAMVKRWRDGCVTPLEAELRWIQCTGRASEITDMPCHPGNRSAKVFCHDALFVYVNKSGHRLRF